MILELQDELSVNRVFFPLIFGGKTPLSNHVRSNEIWSSNSHLKCTIFNNSAYKRTSFPPSFIFAPKTRKVLNQVKFPVFVCKGGAGKARHIGLGSYDDLLLFHISSAFLCCCDFSEWIWVRGWFFQVCI